MRLAENESRQVGMKFEALVELSREAEGFNTPQLAAESVSKACFGVHTRDSELGMPSMLCMGDLPKILVPYVKLEFSHFLFLNSGTPMAL